MNKMSFFKGMGVGLAVGGAIGMAVVPKKKSCKNRVSRALRSVGDVIENVSDVIGI